MNIKCAAVVLCLASAASSQILLNEDLKLVASDAALDDQFGCSMAMDNGIIAVGARYDDDLGDFSGAVYLFDAATGAQLHKLVPSDGAQGDTFGHSVAIEGALLAVGAPYDDDQGGSSGSVYLFNAVTGRQFAKLLANDGAAGIEFGWSVAISDGIVAVGARGDGPDSSSPGAAYLFNPWTLMQTAKLVPNDGVARDWFGNSIAIANGVVAVGSPLSDNYWSYEGSVYLFDAATGAQTAKLRAIGGRQQSYFGWSVAIDEGILAVGSSGDNHRGPSTGSAYLIDVTTRTQLAKLIASDGRSNDEFGYSIAIDGGVVAVGARFDEDSGYKSGSAYLFDVASGVQTAKIVASDAAPGDSLGWSVAIENGVAGAGASYYEDSGTSPGGAYLFSAPVPCPGDIAAEPDTFGASDGQISFVDFLAMLGRVDPCPGGKLGCLGDIADSFGTLNGGDGVVGFGDFLALLGLVGPCP